MHDVIASRPHGTVLLLSAALAVVAPLGCNSEPLPGVCEYGGKSYAAGASFMDQAGCNACSCQQDGTIACDLRYCEPDAGSAQPGSDAGPPADAGPTGCFYNDKWYALGDSFPSTDGCNECTCSQSGVGCTKKACPRSDGGSGRGLSARYEYGIVGGLRSHIERSYLGTGNQYRAERVQQVPGPPLAKSCEVALPPCDSNGRITPREIEEALNHPEVQKALGSSSPALFGADKRPADGIVFELARAMGGSLLIGDDCARSPNLPCVAIPPSVAQLREILLALDKQQRAAPACAGIF